MDFFGLNKKKEEEESTLLNRITHSWLDKDKRVNSDQDYAPAHFSKVDMFSIFLPFSSRAQLRSGGGALLKSCYLT